MAGKLSLAFGPPGVKGVSTIMGIGNTPGEVPADADDMLKTAGLIGVGAFLFGLVTDKPALQHAGLGGAATAFLVRQLARTGG